MSAERLGSARDLEAEAPLATLSGEVSVSPTAVVVRYRFEARPQGRTLLLFDGIQAEAEDGKRKLDPSRAYVTFTEPSCIAARRVIPAAPRRSTVGWGVVPWLRVVQPGEVVSGRIRLRLPVEELSPYFPTDHRSLFQERRADRLRLELAYVPNADVFRLGPIPGLPGFHTFWRTGRSPGDATLAVIGAEAALPEPVPVRKRVDERFEPV